MVLKSVWPLGGPTPASGDFLDNIHVLRRLSVEELSPDEYVALTSDHRLLPTDNRVRLFAEMSVGSGQAVCAGTSLTILNVGIALPRTRFSSLDVKGGVKVDHSGGEKIDHSIGSLWFPLIDLRKRLERRPATPFRAARLGRSTSRSCKSALRPNRATNEIVPPAGVCCPAAGNSRRSSPRCEHGGSAGPAKRLSAVPIRTLRSTR